MNFGEMQAEVIRRLGESATPVHWTLEEIKDSLNEGFMDLCEATDAYEVERQLELDPDTLYYNLGQEYQYEEPFLSLIRIQNPITRRWLDGTSTQELDRRGNYRWQIQPGEPVYTVVRGPYTVGFVPIRTATPIPPTLLLRISALPHPLIWDGDAPFFNREYHVGCADYATYDMMCSSRLFENGLEYWGRYVEIRTALGGGRASGGAVEAGSRTRSIGSGNN